MKVWHRVTFTKHDNADSQIEALNIGYTKTSGFEGFYLLSFELDESDPRWPQVAGLIRKRGVKTIVDTVFTEEEILRAEWIRLVPTFEHGYPQPKETWVTNPTNYEEHCPQCGVFHQTASFRLKGEPNLGKHDFMSLFWTYALFCTARVEDELKARGIQGFEGWSAIIHERNAPSQKVSQLFIPGIANPGLVGVEELKRETCRLCNVIKYYPHKRGVMYLERDALLPDVDIMNTYEWFGSGHSAYREIIVSNRLARLILERGWKGVGMKVVESV